jgi:hypothetical protein
LLATGLLAARLALLAGLALLLSGLLAGLRLVLALLLLRIILARLVLVRHVINSVGNGFTQPLSEPVPAACVPQKSHSSKGFLVTRQRDQEPGVTVFAAAKSDPN